MNNAKRIFIESTFAVSILMLVGVLGWSMYYGIWLTTPEGIIYELSQVGKKDCYPKKEKINILLNADRTVDTHIVNTVLNSKCTSEGIDILIGVLAQRKDGESLHAIIEILKQYEGDKESDILESCSLAIQTYYGDNGILNTVLVLALGNPCQQLRAQKVLSYVASIANSEKFQNTILVYVTYATDPKALEGEVVNAAAYPEELAIKVLDEICYKKDPLLRFRAQFALAHYYGQKSGILNSLYELKCAESLLGPIPDARRIFDETIKMEGCRKPFVELATIDRVIRWVKSSENKLVYDKKKHAWSVEDAGERR